MEDKKQYNHNTALLTMSDGMSPKIQSIKSLEI